MLLRAFLPTTHRCLGLSSAVTTGRSDAPVSTDRRGFVPQLVARPWLQLAQLSDSHLTVESPLSVRLACSAHGRES